MTPIQRMAYYNNMLYKYLAERQRYLSELGEKRRVEERLLNQRINENERVERLKESGKGNVIDKMV